MPALTNSRFGSSSRSEALGTTVWSRCSKWARNRRRISAVSIGAVLVTFRGRRRWSRASRRVGGESASSLARAPPHGRPSRHEPRRVKTLPASAQGRDASTDAVGGEHLDGPLCLDQRVDAGGSPGNEPECAAHSRPPLVVVIVSIFMRVPAARGGVDAFFAAAVAPCGTYTRSASAAPHAMRARRRERAPPP